MAWQLPGRRRMKPGKADETGEVVFDVAAKAAQWAIRVDRTILEA